MEMFGKLIWNSNLEKGWLCQPNQSNERQEKQKASGKFMEKQIIEKQIIEKQNFLRQTIEQVINRYPFMADYFEQNADLYPNHRQTPSTNLASLSSDKQEELAIDVERLTEDYYEYFIQMKDFLGIVEQDKVESLTIIAGYDKSQQKEKFDQITIRQGEIIAIVGPTGSGKSRLLADIEWIADQDTPTKRRILINQAPADKKWRLSSGNKLVAQLSQNMNFVMDLTVREFIELHAASRLVEQVDQVVEQIIDQANQLAGEKFELDSPITSLSGGQSRALMIADTAILSRSPIVLIDEIENAGIDRKKALKLLVKAEKIVLMATHDPILALMANRRIVIGHGAICDLIETTDQEKKMLLKLEQIDQYLMTKRQSIRQGERLVFEALHID